MKQAEAVTFGRGDLDRAADLRNRPDKLQSLLSDRATAVVPLWRGRVLVNTTDTRAVVLAPDHPVVRLAQMPLVFLGLSAGAARFACDISHWAPDGFDADAFGQFFDQTTYRHPALPAAQEFVELRGCMAGLSPEDAALLATAKAIVGWHESHGFCARCGEKSDVTQAGWQRDCPACGARHFPRTDPVVIMLITHGNDVLLGRSPGWPEGMYSLLAGFVEPGETLEAAVRREVFEEAGVQTGAVEYLASQPWPFPSSLMFGCRGEALTRDLTLDPVEIEDALWLSREEVAMSFAGTHPVVKPARKGAIAHFILSHWLADTLE